jgi:hypothetical protein
VGVRGEAKARLCGAPHVGEFARDPPTEELDGIDAIASGAEQGCPVADEDRIIVAGGLLSGVKLPRYPADCFANRGVLLAQLRVD